MTERIICGIGVLTAFVILSSQAAVGQGMPGDGIPDVYYWTAAGDGVAAPNGEVRTAGTLQLDADGVDFVTLFVSSPTDFTDSANCLLCDGDIILPDSQVFGAVYSNDLNQWSRTFPVFGPGPVGIFDLGDDGVGDAVFPPSTVLGGFSAGFGAASVFNVTPIVPEPTSTITALLGLLGVLVLRRTS